MHMTGWTPGPWELIFLGGCSLFILVPATVVVIVLLSKKK
jgi:hypothetical protein